MILQVNNPPLLWLWNLGSQILQRTERTFTSNTQATLQSSTGVLAESSGQGLQLFIPLAVKTHTQHQNTVVNSPFNLFYFARGKKVNWFILTSNKSHFEALSQHSKCELSPVICITLSAYFSSFLYKYFCEFNKHLFFPSIYFISSFPPASSGINPVQEKKKLLYTPSANILLNNQMS